MTTALSSIDWPAVERDLWDRGYAKTAPLISGGDCASLVALYDDASRFRHTVDMARHRFGVGEYRYFAAPLPPLVAALRRSLYGPLAAIANRWMEALGRSERFPSDHGSFLERCAAYGQTKPTPLLLHYEEGGYNCLHRDLYGDVAFPLQAVVFLSRPGIDYTGGEFLLVEQRPRAQSAAEAIAGERGEILLFTTQVRPARGSRGYYRVTVRHGVSRIRSGSRYTLGIIFHDAK